jgi:phosphoglycolate phosphatase-like HAD superfamily hydrolase
MKLNAILFDVGGTIAESEEIHRVSFNEAFKEFGLNWYWDEAIYRELVFIGGGKERIKHYITRAWPEMLKQKNLTKYIESVHKIKGQIYEEFLNDSQLKARPGIIRLLKELKNEKIRLAIVSDTTEENLINLFKKGLGINPIEWFEI